MPRLILVFNGRTLILLVLSCRGSDSASGILNYGLWKFSINFLLILGSKRRNMCFSSKKYCNTAEICPIIYVCIAYHWNRNVWTSYCHQKLCKLLTHHSWLSVAPIIGMWLETGLSYCSIIKFKKLKIIAQMTFYSRILIITEIIRIFLQEQEYTRWASSLNPPKPWQRRFHHQHMNHFGKIAVNGYGKVLFNFRNTFGKISQVMRKSVYAICEQQMCRSAYASAQSDQHLCCLLPR